MKPTLKGLKIPKESFSESGMPAMHQMANCKEGRAPGVGGSLHCTAIIAGAAWLWGAIVAVIYLVIVTSCKVLAPAIPKNNSLKSQQVYKCFELCSVIIILWQLDVTLSTIPVLCTPREQKRSSEENRTSKFKAASDSELLGCGY